jgi:hypothetical protein
MGQVSVGSIETGRCRSKSCDAAVIFAVSKNGGRQILDAEPVPRGTFVLVKRETGEPWAIHLDANLKPEAAVAARNADVALYVDHHATCPDVESWRG